MYRSDVAFYLRGTLCFQLLKKYVRRINQLNRIGLLCAGGYYGALCGYLSLEIRNPQFLNFSFITVPYAQVSRDQILLVWLYFKALLVNKFFLICLQ